MEQSDDLEEAFEKSSLSTSKKGSLFKKKQIKGLKSQRKVTSVDLDGHEDEASQEEAAPVKKRTKFNKTNNRTAKNSSNFKQNLLEKAKLSAADESILDRNQVGQPEEKPDGIEIVEGANIGVLNDSDLDNKEDQPKKIINKRQQYFPADDYLEFGDDHEDVNPTEVVMEEVLSPIGNNLGKHAIDSGMYDNELEVESGVSSDREAETQSSKIKYTLKLPTNLTLYVQDLERSLDHIGSSFEQHQMEHRELMNGLEKIRLKKEDVLSGLASAIDK